MNVRQLTIETLGKLYRTREVSPVEVTKALLEQIDTEDTKLNSYAFVTENLALEQASMAEKELMTGVDRGPLHGVPINLKDNILTAGIQTEVGSTIMRGYLPEKDAVVVTRLKAAGIVLLGKANMLEFAYGKPHPALGVTHNPWNLAHTVSGSSSGSAASVAAGLALGSLGTDTGGSVRLPSSYCGLVGLKPTYGLVSLEGVVPLAWSLDHVGPMTRSVYDNAALLSGISDFNFQPNQFLDGNLADVRIGILHMGDEVTKEVRSAIAHVVERLTESGAIVVREVELPILDNITNVLMGIMLPEASAAHDELLAEYAEQYHPTVRGRIELGSMIPAVDYIRAQRYRSTFCREFDLAMHDLDILILPTTTSSAPRETDIGDVDVLTRFAGPSNEDVARFTGPFNVTGLPALALPTGLGRSGLPLGMQIVGKPFTEGLIYKVAVACEEMTGCKGLVAEQNTGISSNLGT